MRRTTYLRAAICGAVFLGGGAVSSTDVGFVGVGPAEAKPYYTRKRVDGKWVTGRFPKKSAAKKQVASVSRSATRRAKAASVLKEAPATIRVAALPAKAAPVMETPRAAALQAAIRPSTAVPLSEDDRLAKLGEALRARASTLTTGSIAAPQALRPEPQSVSLDFRSGTKTTIFSDGTLITEPFDVGALKGLAAAFPAAQPSLTENAVGPRTPP
jgi:hypothetical protein